MKKPQPQDIFCILPIRKYTTVEDVQIFLKKSQLTIGKQSHRFHVFMDIYPGIFQNFYWSAHFIKQPLNSFFFHPFGIVSHQGHLIFMRQIKTITITMGTGIT